MIISHFDRINLCSLRRALPVTSAKTKNNIIEEEIELIPKKPCAIYAVKAPARIDFSEPVNIVFLLSERKDIARSPTKINKPIIPCSEAVSIKILCGVSQTVSENECSKNLGL